MTIILDFPARKGSDLSSVEKEFGLFTAIEATALIGVRDMNRSKNRLLRVQADGQWLYPGFQFDHASGTVRPGVDELVRVARANKVDDASVVQWICAPSGLLDGLRPVDLLDHPDLVVKAFERRYPTLNWD